VNKDISWFSSYLFLFHEYEEMRQLSFEIYDKYDDFSFPIVNFPFLSSNIPAFSAYIVYDLKCYGT
jgi:hypothetical protein